MLGGPSLKEGPIHLDRQIPRLESILDQWRPVIGRDFDGYHNHCMRMANYCFSLHPCTLEERDKIAIAAAFHDIGIWTDDTVDYIEPSVRPARAYLEDRDRAHWCDEIELMITEHHRLRPLDCAAHPLVEVFRRGDLVDFTWGLVRFGLPIRYIREVKEVFPNAGFHRRLGALASQWVLEHPLDPAPMMKW